MCNEIQIFILTTNGIKNCTKKRNQSLMLRIFSDMDRIFSLRESPERVQSFINREKHWRQEYMLKETKFRENMTKGALS